MVYGNLGIDSVFIGQSVKIYNPQEVKSGNINYKWFTKDKW